MKRPTKSRDWLTRWVLSTRFHSSLSVQQCAAFLGKELGEPVPLQHVGQTLQHVTDALRAELLAEGGEPPPAARWPRSALWLAYRLSPAFGIMVFGWMLRRQTRRMLSALLSLRSHPHQLFQRQLIPMQLSAQASFARLGCREASAPSAIETRAFH